jgi:GNAT superfamily N-acetyltransferase
MPPASGNSPWFVEPLGKQHDRAAFACGNEVLDHYLKEIASQDARRLVAAPFVAVESDDPKTILGYYTLSAVGIALESLPLEVARKLPAYPIVPATLLGRLAVDQRCRGKGIGEFLLMDALRRAYVQSSQIAAVAVVVDAIDAQAARFYRHFNFIPLPDRPDRLFLAIRTIAPLFRDA